MPHGFEESLSLVLHVPSLLVGLAHNPTCSPNIISSFSYHLIHPTITKKPEKNKHFEISKTMSIISNSPVFHSKTYFPVELFTPIHYKHHNLKSKETGCFKKHNVSSKIKALMTESSSGSAVEKGDEGKKKIRVLVAGGGIGGLVFALAAKRKEFEVVVFERDLSAIRGEGQYRGPIQIQSNALAALEAIDLDVADEVMKAGCITGQRINGLVDGVSGNW